MLPVLRFTSFVWLALLWAGTISALAEEPQPFNSVTNLLEIQKVSVRGQRVSWLAGHELRLGPFSKDVSIAFGPVSNSAWLPARLHFKLEGYDANWRQGRTSMNLKVCFYDASDELFDQKIFEVEGNSGGWRGSLKTSTLTHRRETIPVPARASRCVVGISSAGPPSAVGIYVIDDLVMSRIAATNPSPQVLLRTPFSTTDLTEGVVQDIQNWVRSGARPSMAKVVDLGEDSKTKALAIVDDDPNGHAEWRNRIETAPAVAYGDAVVVEWNELYCVGVADTRSVLYPNLPSGDYRFRVQAETIFGDPTGVEASLSIHVAAPFWTQSWFWIITSAMLVASSVAGVRYRAYYKLQREVERLQHQRESERERLRIARDIHDDLGAAITQISMLSAMAPDNPTFPQNARADFDRICRMSRDLISSLYETVWAVSPENDTLYALGNYLRQITSQHSEVAQLRCRLHIPVFPRDVQVSSQTRHNVTMAVKEALHNVIKHARATEVIVRATFAERLLSISVQDDGCGFQATGRTDGNGLINMKQRLEELGGSCAIESQSGQGTTVHLRLTIKADSSMKLSPKRPQP